MLIALLAAALSADPVAPPSLRSRISDPAVIRAAVKIARVPSCLHPDHSVENSYK